MSSDRTRQGVRNLNLIGPRSRPPEREPATFWHSCSAERHQVELASGRVVWQCRVCGAE